MIGADIEFFVYDNNKKAVVAPSLNILKDGPINRLTSYIDEDGTALEIHPSPSNSKAELKFRIYDLEKTVCGLAEKADCQILKRTFVGAVDNNKEKINVIPNHNTTSNKPIYCAYDYYLEASNDKKKDDSDFMRTAGLHLHFGEKENADLFKYLAPMACKIMDIYIAFPLTLLNVENESIRRTNSIYGRAGSFRYTDYGFEYRPISTGSYSELDFILDRAYKIDRMMSSQPIEFVKMYDEIRMHLNSEMYGQSGEYLAGWKYIERAINSGVFRDILPFSNATKIIERTMKNNT